MTDAPITPTIMHPDTGLQPIDVETSPLSHPPDGCIPASAFQSLAVSPPVYRYQGIYYQQYLWRVRIHTYLVGRERAYPLVPIEPFFPAGISFWNFPVEIGNAGYFDTYLQEEKIWGYAPPQDKLWKGSNWPDVKPSWPYPSAHGSKHLWAPFSTDGEFSLRTMITPDLVYVGNPYEWYGWKVHTEIQWTAIYCTYRWAIFPSPIPPNILPTVVYPALTPFFLLAANPFPAGLDASLLAAITSIMTTSATGAANREEEEDEDDNEDE